MSGIANSETKHDFSTLSFPRIPEVAPHKDHPQAQCVLNNLKKDNPSGYAKLQTIVTNSGIEMIDNDLTSNSMIVPVSELNIEGIVCHQPSGGTRVLRIYNVMSVGWSKIFTGNRWRIDAKTIGGEMANTFVKLDKNGQSLIVDMKMETAKSNDNKQLHNVTITNIAISNTNDVTFGENKRAVTLPHLVGTYYNPVLMENKFNYKNKGINILRISQGFLAKNIAKDSIMPLDDNIVGMIKYDTNMTHKIGIGNTPGVVVAKILSDQCPDIKDHMYIFSSDNDLKTARCTHNGLIIKINNSDGNLEEWATNSDTWKKLLKTVGEQVCTLY